MQFLIFVGGLIGLAFNGWRGAVIGALLVWALLPLLGRLLVKTAMRKVSQVQHQFLDSTFAVMGAVCKADGQVSSEEIRVAEALFEQLHLSPDAREAARRAFNRGKAADFDLDAEVARFAAASARAPVFRQLFLQIQVQAIAADGQMHPAEHAMLLRIARGLGLSEHDVAMLEAMMRGGGPGAAGNAGNGRRPDSASSLDDAYQVLDVPASASDTEVKRAYRKLMSENHPDKLAAKGLPESMRALAEEKTRRITAAYERIERARGGIKS
jgi:DnaJ like chaperone protein